MECFSIASREDCEYSQDKKKIMIAKTDDKLPRTSHYTPGHLITLEAIHMYGC